MQVDDVVEIRFVGRIGDQNTINVRHFRVTAQTGGGLGLTQLTQTIFNQYKAHLQLVSAPAWTLRGALGRQVYPVATPLVVYADPAPGSGTLVGNPLPYQTCALISLRSTFAPPKTRGRFYCPPATANEMDVQNQWTPGYQTSLATLAANLSNNFDANDGAGNGHIMDPVIWRRLAGSGPSITSFVVRTLPATQRRRSRVSGADPLAIT